MGERTELTPETLLAHAGWLRRLAASLVPDPGAADDVVQDTYLAALRFARDTEVNPGGSFYSYLDEAEPIEWSYEVFPGRTTRHDLDLRPR